MFLACKCSFCCSDVELYFDFGCLLFGLKVQRSQGGQRDTTSQLVIKLIFYLKQFMVLFKSQVSVEFLNI